MEKCIPVKLTSYRLVSQELLKTLEQAKVHFESFTEDKQSHGQLAAFVDLIEQTVGCLKILKLQGVNVLAAEILQLANHIHQTSAEQRDTCFAAISCALIELEQYLDYLNQKETEFPSLLLGTINKLRSAGKRQALPEHYFYSQNSEFIEAITNSLDQPVDTAYASIPPDRLRRLRQMYQIGLADYIRETNVKASLGMMTRSLSRTMEQQIPSSYSLIFRFAAAALEAMSDSTIEPTKQRKQLFAAVDQQFRNLTDNPDQAPKTEHSYNLVRGFGYLFLISGCKSASIIALVEQYSIKPLFFTERDIIIEQQFFGSPDASANRSFMRALSTKLTSLKDNIELAFKTSELQQSVDFSNLIEPIKEICSIFEMAKMTDSAQIMNEVATRIEEWDIQNTVISEEEFSEIADQLTLIENQALQPAQSKSKGSGAAIVKLGILQEAQQHVIDETKGGLALTKHSIDAYLSSGGDSMNLVNLTTLMTTVRGGTQFLGLKEVTEILKICQNFIQTNLVESHESLTSESLETLADVIISVEYYLENMDMNLNSNRKILALAEDGVKELAA